jgi:orotate phosphoribosyltransferase
MDQDEDRKGLIEALRRDALRTGTFTLASGRTSHYYVDGRKVTLSATGASLVGGAVLGALAEFPAVESVGGMTMGADPIVGASLALAPSRGRGELRGFLVRKQAKAHGTGQRIEGSVGPGTVVAILDDVVTTGGSALDAAAAVESAGGTVAVVIAMLDRLEGAAEAFAARGYPFRALCTIRDLGVEPLPPLAEG